MRETINGMKPIIRPYSPADRAAVRHICCETGFSGAPIDPVFDDREVFADFFTRYYTDWEPENCFVVNADEEVVGYLLASLRPYYHTIVSGYLMGCLIAPKVMWRFILGRYNSASRAFLKWCCFRGGRETPKAPKNAGHFHFNILPEYRNVGVGVRLLTAFEEKAKAKGVRIIYGQIQTYDHRRTEKVFNKFGFHLYDRRTLTRFRSFHNKRVYVSTVVKELG